MKTRLTLAAALATATAGFAAPRLAGARDLTLHLQSASGHFLVAEGGGGGAVNANRPVASTWETFTLLDLTGGDLLDGDPVALRTLNGRFVRAEGTGLTASGITPTVDAVFELEFVTRIIGGTDEGSQIALRSAVSGLYVVAEHGGGDHALADRARRDAWETFTARGLRPAGVSETRGRLSAPFLTPGPFLPPVGRDYREHDPAAPGRTEDCTDWRSRGAPHCYNGHTGTDFLLAGGFAQMDLEHVPVVAAMGGIVLETDDGSVDHCHYDPTVKAENQIVCPGRAALSSNYVLIRQDDGLIAQYHHMRRDSVRVRPGQRVECGDWLGDIGSSGISSTAHLHFELNRPTDGLAFIAGADFTDEERSDVVDPFREGLFAHLDAHEVPLNVCVSADRTILCEAHMTRLDCGAHEDELDAFCDGLAAEQSGLCAEREPAGCIETCADACQWTTRIVNEIVDAGALAYCISILGVQNPDAYSCPAAVRRVVRQVLDCRSDAAQAACRAADDTCVAIGGEICHARCSDVCAPVQETFLAPCRLRRTYAWPVE